mgnify:CR=1 FL=1
MDGTVLAGRSLEAIGRLGFKEQIEKISDGSIFLGKDAKEIGLVDEIGTLDDAKEMIKRLSNAEHATFFEMKKRGLSLFDLFKD